MFHRLMRLFEYAAGSSSYEASLSCAASCSPVGGFGRRAMAMRKAPCSPADSRLAVSSPWSLHYFQSVNGFCHCQMTWRVAITDGERVCCMQFIASRASGVGSVVVILEELREVKINGGGKKHPNVLFL